MAAIIFMVACAFAIGCLQYLTPWQGDDLVYGLKWKDAMTGSRDGADMRRLWDFACRHYVVTNGRIGDKLILILLTDLPKWATATFSGLAALSMFLFGSLASFGSIRRHPLRTCVLTGLIVCCMPWYIAIFLTNMTLNYLWGTGLTAIVIWLLVRQRALGIGACTGVFALSFVASGWHEACSVPLSAGIILFLVLNRGRNKRVRYVILAGALAGMIFTLCAPGFWDRMGRDILPEENACIQPFHVMVRGIWWGINVGLLAFAAPIMLIRKRKAKANADNLSISFGCLACMCIAVSVGIFFMTSYSLRVFWYCNFIALSAVCAMFSSSSGALSPKIRRVLAWGLVIFVMIHLGVSLNWQKRITNQYIDIIKAYVDSADGTVYYDYSGNGYGPLLNMRKAQIFAINYEMRFSEKYIMGFYRNDSSVLSLVPTDLRDFDMDKWPRHKNTAIINGHIISSDTTLIQRYGRTVNPLYKYSDGKERRVRTLLNPFKAKNGTPLLYFEIDRRVGSNKGIVDIEI